MLEEVSLLVMVVNGVTEVLVDLGVTAGLDTAGLMDTTSVLEIPGLITDMDTDIPTQLEIETI